MNLTINYENAIHPECGKTFEVINDIIITPFYTEEFCNDLVKMCDYYTNKFSESITYTKPTGKTSPWNTLFFSYISPILFEEFAKHYKQHLCPLIEKNFAVTGISGWFSPMIIKYSQKGQDVELHNDTSKITMNVKLNNDFEGCDLEFPRQNWNNKDLPVGWSFMWPSQVTHPHVAKPLISGTKYSLASWTHPMTWDPDQNGGSILYDHI
jgi:hypothetical protein